MGQSLRLLMVEDSEDDAFLLLRELRRAGYAVTWERVDTPGAMRTALEREPWDVVTSDHAMPKFSAPAALALLKEVRPHLPFIIVSNEIDLNLAVSLMKAGAQDYIPKRELAKVGPAIHRELREVEVRHERQQAEAALRNSEKKYRDLAELLPEAAFEADLDGRLTFVNRRAFEMFGYEPADLAQGLNVFDLAHPEDRPLAHQNLARHLNGTGPKSTFYRGLRKDGQLLYLELTATVSRPEGGPASLRGVVTDITERVEMEKVRQAAEDAMRRSEELFRSYFELPLFGGCITSPTKAWLAVNAKLCEMLGYSREELLQTTWEELTPLEERATEAALFERWLADPRNRATIDKHYRRKDGSLIKVRVSTECVRSHDGTVDYLVSAVQDLSALGPADEAGLRDSEERLRQLTASLREAVWLRNTQTLTLLYVNPAYETIWGRSVESFYADPTSFMAAVHPDDKDRVMQAIQAQAHGEPFDLEYRILRPDGDLRWVWGRTFPVRDAAGQVYRMAAVAEDITTRKIAELEKEERWQAERLLAGLSSTFFNLPGSEVEAEITRGLQQVAESLGADRGSLLEFSAGETGFKVRFAYEAPGLELPSPVPFLMTVREYPNYIETLRSGQPVIIERVAAITQTATAERSLSERIGLKSHVAVPLMTGSNIWGAITFANFRHERAWPAEVVMYLRLVGEVFVNALNRQRAEAALQQERSLFIAGPVIGVRWAQGSTWGVEYISPNFAEQFGYAPEDLTTGRLDFTNLVHPDDRGRVVDEAEAFMVTGTEWYEQEYRLARADGQYRWVRDFTRTVYDANGTPQFFFGYLMDITTRKQTEEEIHQRSRELETVGRLISTIATNLNLQELLDQALKGALELTGLEGGTLCLVKSGGQTLALSAYQNTSAEMVAALSAEEVRVGDCLCGHVALTGSPLILWDNASASTYATREALRGEGLRFHAAFPLSVKGRTIGVLCLFARSATRPTQRQLELVQQLCGPIALAIDNAQLYEQAQQYAAELEQRVTERTLQLAAINQELEAFSYSVAHDLRAPLRTIDGFSQILLEDFTSALGAEGGRHLQRIRTASERMSRLIEDLLELSRLTRGEINRSLLDMSAMAQAIADELTQRDPVRQVQFNITPGIVVRADAELLRAALENLLGNAWKFTAKTVQAVIEFGTYLEKRDNQEERVYFVRDNGAGFDMALVDQLFKAFQRLHAADEFPGTGIGLATVRRIIHRHGGRVWAEGAEGRGATFYFTL